MVNERSRPVQGLYTAEIRLTRACNLSCRHCSVRAGEAGLNELTSKEVKNLIAQLAEMDARYLIFTGGEPLLREDVAELTQFAASRGLRVSIDTNGVLLSKEKSRDLRRAGVSTIQVSIDGSRKTHDYIRGKGAFEKATEGISNAVSEGLYTSVNFTVSRLNQKELPPVIQFSKSLGAKALTMERLAPVGRGSNLKKEAQSPEEFKESLKILFNETDLKTNSTDPLAVFMKKEVLKSYREEDLFDRIRGGCTAGIAALTISSDGEVYPCPKLELSCGNVRDSGLKVIWLESPVLKKLRFRELKGTCGICRWKNLCGGCRAVAQAYSGDCLNQDPGCFIEVSE